MVSGITKEWQEPSDIYKINPSSFICNGCFNNPNYIFGAKAKSNWSVCFAHEGTEKQFECTKTIPPERIIKEIESVIN